MAIQLQLRKGTKAQNDAFVGAEGELTYDTQTQGLRIHDGTTQGGHMIDTVVAWQVPTAENNYTWYRKYASGWVEQGCSALTNISPSGVTLSLPVTMSQFQYMVILTPISYSGDGIGVSVVSRTENSFIAKNKNYGSSATVPCLWQVSGMAA